MKHSNYVIVKEKRINLSNYIDNCIERDYLSKEKIKEKLMKEIEDNQREIKLLDEQIEKEKKIVEENIKSLSEEELQELKESIRIIEEKGEEYFEGRTKRYNYIFKKKLSIDEFEKLLEGIKKEQYI